MKISLNDYLKEQKLMDEHQKETEALEVEKKALNVLAQLKTALEETNESIGEIKKSAKVERKTVQALLAKITAIADKSGEVSKEDVDNLIKEIISEMQGLQFFHPLKRMMLTLMVGAMTNGNLPDCNCPDCVAEREEDEAA